MRLILVPIIEMKHSRMGVMIRGPALPEDVVWHQASSLWDSKAGGFQTLVLAEINDEQALAWAKGGLVVVDEMVDLGKLGSEMREMHADWPDVDDLRIDAIAARGTMRAKDTARRFWDAYAKVVESQKPRIAEYLATYRDPAEKFERSWFGPMLDGVVALTTLHQDNFNRSDRALSGDTMSDGLGVWTTTDGTDPQIISNTANRSSGASSRYAMDGTMSAVDEQLSSIARLSTSNRDNGPTTRMQSITTGYWLDAFSATLFMWRENAGLSLIGSGGLYAANDVVALYSVGNSHSGVVNGSTQLPAITDANFTTGKAGFNAFADTPSSMDDWSVQVAASGTVVPALEGEMLSGGFQEMGGGL